MSRIAVIAALAMTAAGSAPASATDLCRSPALPLRVCVDARPDRVHVCVYLNTMFLAGAGVYTNPAHVVIGC